MTTVEAVAYRPVAAPRRDVVAPLALQEARRLLLHPIFLVGLALSISVMAATFFHHASGRDALLHCASLWIRAFLPSWHTSDLVSGSRRFTSWHPAT